MTATIADLVRSRMVDLGADRDDVLAAGHALDHERGPHALSQLVAEVRAWTRTGWMPLDPLAYYVISRLRQAGVWRAT